MDELHAMGFSVMLWVTPNIACAGPRFRELCALGYLLRDAEQQIALRAGNGGNALAAAFRLKEDDVFRLLRQGIQHQVFRAVPVKPYVRREQQLLHRFPNIP